MTPPTYEQFFKKATGGYNPFDYQTRLTEDAEAKSRLINIPTGLGKTAAVVLAWLWNRVEQKRADWPRRLVYCLPMRTLVEQTRDNVRTWLGNLGSREWKGVEKHNGKVGLHILMGGEEREDNPWDLYPEHDAILIGTQDMLLSRALNRGYGMSRYRWPMHFGLLNSDCLWVIDETQLMGSGLTTTVQLDTFRQQLWKTARPCPTWWMSATSAKTVFNTTDRRELAVSSPDYFPKESDALTDLGDRLNAQKQIEVIAAAPKPAAILEKHQPGRITLLIMNTVGSALKFHQEIGAELKKRQSGGKKKKGTEPKPIPELHLLHSRFRRKDRDEILKRIQAFQVVQPKDGSAVPDHPGIVIVSTQVIEAGYDLSSFSLWSEIAPWASVIQRLGRLNRDGKCYDAKALFWMPKHDKKGENSADAPNARRLGPYDKKAAETARALLGELSARLDHGMPYREALEQVQGTTEAIAALESPITHAIRPDDLHGLFSTEPDLAGGFTNIAAYVRDGDRNSDITVYWREFKGTPPENLDEPGRDETVTVPFFDFQNFLKTQKCQAFLWDEDGESWNRLFYSEVVPGMTLLLPRSAGGYSETSGWTGRKDHQPKIWPLDKPKKLRRLFADGESETGWESLGQHTDAVCRAVKHLFSTIEGLDDFAPSAALAARWHDIGKAHIRWQKPLNGGAPGSVPAPWGKFTGINGFHPGFRHEALSLLCAWSHWPDGTKGFTALALFFIATHHGKVRTTLRSTGEGNNLFGLRETDEPLLLPGFADTPFAIDSSRKSFTGRGQFNWEAMTYLPEAPSWTAIIDELLGTSWRDDPAPINAVPEAEPRRLGPFCLAYLETLFRAADARASRGDFPIPRA
jgi:CRISPR-associated endonuclease/helicase Cas3